MGKSSKDKRDAYYRLAKEQNWRARSAFKLIQLDEQFDLFSCENPEQCTRVVDLCAAPGSWSQVLSRVLIKGEPFGRRKWIEKMANFNSDIEKSQTETHESSEMEADAASENEDKVPVNDLLNLHLESTPPISDTTPTSTPTTDLRPRTNVKIVAIDLQPMAPLSGIIQLKADITHPSTIPLLLSALDIPTTSSSPTTNLVDLVISDGAPDVTGLHDLDIYIQSSLLHAALSLAIKVLRPGGKFVAKIFRGRNVDVIYAQLKLVFEKVTVAKPRSSRASSVEAFVVCEGFIGMGIDEWEAVVEREVDDFEVDGGERIGEEGNFTVMEGREMVRRTRDDGTVVLEFAEDKERDSRRWIAPFLACGDLDSYDADATYKLPPDYVSLPPVQPPTAPPYKEALERRRIEGGMYGKTKKRNKDEKQ